MKTKQNTARWLGLALACGIITSVASVHAKKGGGGKPPPEPPPAAAYDLVLLGDPGSSSYAIDVNESGLVLGSTATSDGNYHPTLVVPEADGTTTIWRKDVNLDGRNDLLVDLGVPEGAGPLAYPCAINDHGVILGSGYDALLSTKFAWILAPQVLNGQLIWINPDSVGINSLMVPVPALATADPQLEVTPQSINNYGSVALVIQWIDWDTHTGWQRGFLLLPNHYEVSAEGAVTLGYPEADLNGDGLNDSLVDLGWGVSLRDGAVRPLLPAVINDRGDVAGVVWGNNFGDVSGGTPFVLRPRFDENLGLIWNEDKDGDGLNDLVLYLPLPAGVHYGAIQDMNENGTIVGSVTYDPQGSRAAIWQVDWDTGAISYSELGMLNRQYNVTNPRAVNAAGQVVGRSLRYMKSLAVYEKGWLLDGGDMVALDDLVPPETGLADISSAAVGINDSGMIVGYQQLEYPGKWTSFIALPVAGQQRRFGESRQQVKRILGQP